MATPDPANPWGWNAFGDDPPKVDSPTPFKPKDRVFPEQDRLFKVQNDALKAVNEAREMVALAQRGKDNKLERQAKAVLDAAEDTYRVIRSYLDKYVNPQV